jgi:hypothetical protein
MSNEDNGEATPPARVELAQEQTPVKRDEIIGEFSEAVIKRYLTDRIYEKRGLTREEYIERCKAAWAQVKYDPEFERKVIVDFSQPVTVTQLFGLDDVEADFVDDALTELPVREFDFEHKEDIVCMVYLAAPAPETTGSVVPQKISEMFRPDKPKPEVESLEQQPYLIAVFDVLGFSALVREKGIQVLLGMYQDLIARVVLNTNYTGFGRIKVGPGKFCLGGFYAPVNYAYFSDTILLWTTRQFTHVSPFLAKCGDLVCEALKIGLPLRGSVCFGEAVMHKASNTFLGPALVEANEMEKNQNWIGATLGASFMLNELKEALSEALVVPLFCEHFKPEMKTSLPYLTLDWVGRWRLKANPDVITMLESMKAKAPEKNKVYYDNTISFVTFRDLDDLQIRGQFLHATTYRVVNLSKIRLDAAPHCPVVLKVVNEIPHCGFILKFPPDVLRANTPLRELVESNVLFVKRLDYPKFVANLSDAPGSGFDLSKSGVVWSVEKKHVEYLDLFNLDPKEPPTKSLVNMKIVR